MILSLNCARGESSTYAVLSFVLGYPHYYLLLLQEPWFNANHELPPAGFGMFVPTPTDSKCAIYVRKSAYLKPALAFSELNCFLGISQSLLGAKFTIYNLYPPGRQHTVCHILHTFQPATNSITCGDFNSHHRMWYGHRATQYQKQLSGDSGLADTLVERMVGLALDL